MPHCGAIGPTSLQETSKKLPGRQPAAPQNSRVGHCRLHQPTRGRKLPTGGCMVHGARGVPVCAVLPHCGAIGATSALRETSRQLPRSCPSGSQHRPPWVGGGPLRQPLPPWPTSGAVPPCKACRQPLVPGLVWAGWHEASPLNRATLAVFEGGGGGPRMAPGAARGGALVPQPPLAAPG